MSGRLESFETLPLSLKRGKCYTIVLRLEAGASLSEHARAGVGFIYTGVGDFDSVHGGPGIAGPGGVGSAGCPQRDAPSARFDLQAIRGSATDKSRIHELGTGGFTLQLYSKPISDADLARQTADQDRQIAESEEFNRREKEKEINRARNGCAVCQAKHTECIADWRRGR